MKNIPSAKKTQNLDIQYEYGWDEAEQCSEEKFVKRSQKSNFQGLNTGNWTQEENAQLAVFMELNFDIFSNKKKRKDSKIFLVFSNLIKSRNPPQCRSHFQKKMKKFKTINAMITFYKNSLGIQRYYELMDALKSKQHPKGQQQEPKFEKINQQPLNSEVKVEQEIPSDHSKSQEEKYTNDSQQNRQQEFVGIKEYLKAFCLF